MDNKNGRKAVIAIQIKEAMSACGLSRKQLAEKLGRNPSEITKWLSGKHNFTTDLLEEVSDSLGVQITGVSLSNLVDGYDKTVDAKRNSGRKMAAVFNDPAAGEYTLEAITLQPVTVEKLKEKARQRGSSLKSYIEQILGQEAERPAPEAVDFCGIWKDCGMSQDELKEEILSHRTSHNIDGE